MFRLHELLLSVRPIRKLRHNKLLSDCNSFQDVLVVPYQNLLSRQAGGHDHQGGPVWPDWEQQHSARFNRNCQPQDALPEPAEPEMVVDGEHYYWGGPVHPHFGHGVADFYSRLPGALAQSSKAVLVFASRSSHPIKQLEDAPSWFRGLMNWYDVPSDRVMFVTRPTLFKSLKVTPQQEQLENVGPSPAYLDLLDAVVSASQARGALTPLPDFDPQRPTYVSRAAMNTCFAGEGYLESVLMRCGCNVFCPERHGLRRQMDTYLGSPRLIFPEGSAIHGTQLLGRSLGAVSVLVRRPGSRFAEAFLRPRAEHLEYVEVTKGLIHGLNHRGRALLSGGIPVLEKDLLQNWFAESGVQLRNAWNDTEYAAAQEADVRSWLQFTSKQPHSLESKAMICKTIEDEGFGRFSGMASDLLFD